MRSLLFLKRAASTALLALCAIGLSGMAAGGMPAATPAATKPTIVLVHGALADASSWDGVIARLQAHGYTVIAAPDPLRSLKGDSDYVLQTLRSVAGPVVLVGHSYGGSVISNAANEADNVKALVYVAAFAPVAGESAFDLAGRFPGSQLPGSLAPPVALGGGVHDLYVQQGKFRGVFAADVPARQATLMAATQRPVADAALKEGSGPAAWSHLPTWFVYGDADQVIPPAAHAFMAQRAGARQITVVKGASHVVMISHPAAVAELIEKAAAEAASAR